MPSEPRTVGDLLDRAVGGITYKGGDDDSFLVVYEGRETDTYVSPFRGPGPDAWLVGECRGMGDDGSSDWDFYTYRLLSDFERAYIAREGAPRNPKLGGANNEWRVVDVVIEM